jgi:molybdenum cofactor cytidylyltransferase
VIVALVLAAGLATRFRGRQAEAGAQVGVSPPPATESKVLVPVGGIPIVRHVVARLQRVPVARIIVVAGEDAEAVAAVLGTAATVATNPRPRDGLASSLAVGIDALPAECSAVVVALGDQPLIDPAVVRTLLATWESSNAAAVVPRYRDAEWGHPLVIDLSLRDRLRALRGDAGARGLLQSLGDRLVRLPVDASAPVDVDTPADLDRIAPEQKPDRPGDQSDHASAT